MREARIIAPIANLAARVRLEESLTNAFGGWTKYAGIGYWRGLVPQRYGQMECIAIYDIAVDPDRETTLRAIAAQFCWAAKQECVYLRLPNGEVEFVTAELLQYSSETSPPIEGTNSAAEHGRRVAERRRVNRPWDENGE